MRKNCSKNDSIGAMYSSIVLAKIENYLRATPIIKLGLYQKLMFTFFVVKKHYIKSNNSTKDTNLVLDFLIGLWHSES